MGKFKHYIEAPKDHVDESSYEGNIGFEEMVNFYQKASDKEVGWMEEYIKKDDWTNFKKIIKKVLNVVLK